MRQLLIAISFFTRFPITLKDVDENEFYNSMILMPIVGILIGLLLAVAAWIFSFIRIPALQAVLMLITYLWISGGLHLDGFGDTIDGIFSSRDHDRMMEIMKDSRLGSFGAIALILLFLTEWSAYTQVLPVSFLAVGVMPVVGRYCALQACCFSTYAKGGGGLGKRVVEMTKPWHVLVYLVMTMALAFLTMQWAGVVAALVTVICGLLLTAYLRRRIGGMTGDTIGFTIELSQAIYLVAITIVLLRMPELAGL